MDTKKVEFVDGTTAARLDQLGWGIFLVMIGTIWLVPGVPPGAWMVGTGILLLALSVIRARLAIPWSGFWVAVGVIALIAGIGSIVGIALPLFPICLVVIGASLILKPLFSQHA